MMDTSTNLDEGAVMRSFVPTNDASGRRMTFSYADLTQSGTSLVHRITVAVESHLLTYSENARMLEAVMAVQVPGTTLVQAADGAWRLRSTPTDLSLNQS